MSTPWRLVLLAVILATLPHLAVRGQIAAAGDPANSTFKIFAWHKNSPTQPEEGTAFVVGATGDCNNPTLYFLTAAHVVLGEDATDSTPKAGAIERIEIRFDSSAGGAWPVAPEAVWVPPNWETSGKDFALLKIVNAGRRIPPLPLAKEEPETAYERRPFQAFGVPATLPRVLTVSGEVLDKAPGNSHPSRPWLLVASPFSPGMSGGPLTTAHGVFATVQGRSKPSVDLKYAVPISQATSFLNDNLPPGANERCRETPRSSTPLGALTKKPLRIALLLNGEVYYTREVLEVFTSTLRKNLEDTDYALVVEYATGFPEESRAAETAKVLESLLEKFPNKKPDYLITVGTQVAEVAHKKYGRKIPIIFIAVTDPVRSGLVKTFAPDRSRGPTAGVVYGVPIHVFLTYFQRAFPGQVFGFVFNPDYPQDVAFRDQVLGAAPSLVPPLTVVPIEVQQPRLSAEQVEMADIFFGRFYLMANLQQFLAHTNKPFVAGDISNVYKGAVLSVNTDSKELARLAVDKIILPNLFSGVALSDLPVLYPSQLVTGVNLQAARHYGVAISQAAISEAQVVIR